MYRFHEVRAIPGIGSGVIITGAGCDKRGVFAEYHVLFPERNYTKFQELRTDNLAEESLLQQADKAAKDFAQHYVDVCYSKGKNPLSVVELADGDASLIQRLWISGKCKRQLEEIAESTLVPDLKSFLEQVRHLPVISRSEP
ncbi:MAG: hypothetical protein NTW68_05320 [candidate division NC10 bacterium]|nr:hypothetical protein [candidate division NC10 bacterium]